MIEIHRRNKKRKNTSVFSRGGGVHLAVFQVVGKLVHRFSED